MKGLRALSPFIVFFFFLWASIMSIFSLSFYPSYTPFIHGCTPRTFHIVCVYNVWRANVTAIIYNVYESSDKKKRKKKKPERRKKKKRSSTSRQSKPRPAFPKAFYKWSKLTTRDRYTTNSHNSDVCEYRRLCNSLDSV